MERPWTIVALRDAAQNRLLGRRLRALGYGFVGVPALRLRAPPEHSAAAAALARALACPVCLFTSPAAVRFAARLGPLVTAGTVIAVGSGTAAALRRAGVDVVLTPEQGMHSEGVLALSALSAPPATVGLVTAPGGRGLLEAALQQRGATVQRADVYGRGGGRIDRRHSAQINAIDGPIATWLSSAEALAQAWSQLGAAARDRLQHGLVVASSERLAALARQHGCRRVAVAASARPDDLLAALPAHAKPEAIR